MTFADPILLLGLLLVPAGARRLPPGPAPAQPLRRPVHERRPARQPRAADAGLAPPRAAGPLPRRDRGARPRARPAVDDVAVPREEATIILTMDVSGSMKATDVAPTRLAAAQKAASDFVDQLPAAFKVGPRRVLDGAADPRRADDRPGAAPCGPRRPAGPRRDRARRRDRHVARGRRARSGEHVDGARRPSPAPSGRRPRRPARPRRRPAVGIRGHGATTTPIVATVLLSDGANSTGQLEPIPAAEQAAALDVPVYTIALGTADGVVDVPDDQGQLHTPQRPAGHRDARRDRRDDRRPLLRGADRRRTSPRSTRASARRSATRTRSRRSPSGSPRRGCSSSSPAPASPRTGSTASHEPLRSACAGARHGRGPRDAHRRAGPATHQRRGGSAVRPHELPAARAARSIPPLGGADARAMTDQTRPSRRTT